MSFTIEFNEQFKKAIDLMSNTDKSLFVTGKAGTGKSTLLQYFCTTTNKNPVVLAPTGVAALNVKGQTIHSFFNFYVDVTPQQVLDKKRKPRDTSIYKNLKTIIIDEISMVRADLLDCIDTFLRMYGPNNHLPFGGIQMVLIGDLYQLPPVVTNNEQALFTTHYSTPYFFSAHVIQNLELEMIELEAVYRQKDQKFVELLNRIRNNSVELKDLEHLNSRHNKDDHTNELYISLTTTNKAADQVNSNHLDDLNSDMHISYADIKGDFSKEYFPTATELQFKIGSQIMLLNNDPKKRWVNGSIGTITSLGRNDEDEQYVKVNLHDSHKSVHVYKYTWEVFRFHFDGQAVISEAVGTFAQYPFRMAWAITIHKSQGKTFERVIIDIGSGTFVAGQLYVALSRCTSLEGIVLKTLIKPHHIRTDNRILRFLTEYQYAKAEQLLSLDKKIQMIKQAIESNSKLAMTYLRTNDSKLQCTVTPLTMNTERYQDNDYPGMKAIYHGEGQSKMFHVGRILHLEKI